MNNNMQRTPPGTAGRGRSSASSERSREERQSSNDSIAAAKGSARMQALLDDLNRPLDTPDYKASKTSAKSSSRSIGSRLRGEDEHSMQLRRARRAATKALGVRSKMSTRRRAGMMLTAGAVGLTAFTGPGVTLADTKQRSGYVEAVDRDEIRMPAAMLSASDEFKQALIEEEGVRYIVYRDVAGYPTVGVGHLIRPQDNLRVGDRIDEQQVMQFLEDDLKHAEQGVRKLVRDLPVHQHEFDALLDLVYNVGYGNVSERESPRLNAAIEAGDYEAIAAELDYTHAAGRVARGLQYRSERRAQIFMDGSYDDPREVRALRNTV